MNSCPQHGVLLEFRCRACAALFDPMLQPGRCRCGTSVDFEPVACTPGDTEADAYVLGRLLGVGAGRCAILDDVGVFDAYMLMLSVGSFGERGERARRGLRRMSPTDRAGAASRGLRIFQNWPVSFRRLLDDIQAGVQGSPVSDRIPDGTLASWLGRLVGPAWEPVRQEVIAHMARFQQGAARGGLFGLSDVARVNHVRAGSLSNLRPSLARAYMRRLGLPVEPGEGQRWWARRGDVLLWQSGGRTM